MARRPWRRENHVLRAKLSAREDLDTEAARRRRFTAGRHRAVLARNERAASGGRSALRADARSAFALSGSSRRYWSTLIQSI